MGEASRGTLCCSILALALAMGGVGGCRCGSNGDSDSGDGPGTDATGTDATGTDATMIGDGGGTDATTDSAPMADCGNAVVEPPEECDDANTSEDDLCLNDCTFACGDGVVNAIELCDPGIASGPGSCPTSCDDGDPCTTDTLSGSGCTAECLTGMITAPVDGDLCCPPGENNNTDSDCPVTCDNGAIEGAETCDPIASCPTSCDDGIACTTNVMSGSPATCDAACSFPLITACTAGDGCCPGGCTFAGGDTDCSGTCDNGVIDPGETCDPPATCPTACDDGVACTTNLLVGSAANCDAECQFPAITMPAPGDGCCPAGANNNTDPECPVVCGNGAVETGETCDDGNTTSGDGCDMLCQSEVVPTAFRMTDLDLMDPHIYVDIGFPFGCQDVTNSVPLGLAASVNERLETAITTDGDGDMFLDLSFLLIFRPLDQGAAAMGVMDFAVAECTDPIATTSCDLDPLTPPETSTFTNMSMTCMSPYPGTLTPLGSGYSPAVTDAMSPCFVSTSINITLDLGGALITLQDAQAAATYVGTPAGSLTNGLLRGFLSEADADAAIIDLGALGMMPISDLLPDGPGGDNCASHNDMDVALDGVTPGWWFYLNFSPGDLVTYTGP